MRRAAPTWPASTRPRRRCGSPTTACRCSAATASSGSIPSRCGTATRAPSACSRARSRSDAAPRAKEKPMIDLNVTANDQRVLDAVREEALIARTYARYYDENEHEFPPNELPEAKGRPGFMSRMGERTGDDAGMAVLTTLIAMGQTWGDYSVRMRRNERGLGNSALQAAGSDEQKRKWRHHILAMAITEPGCGSDPSLV